MKTTLALILSTLLLCGCSGDKGTDSRSDITFRVNTSEINLTSVETAVWPLTTTLRFKNVDEDSVELSLFETCDWLSLSKSSVKIASGDSSIVTATVSMKNLLEGEHKDTILIIDYGNGGLAAMVAVNVVATPDSTYAEFAWPSSTNYYLGPNSGLHCYSVNSAWYIIGHSNSGNPVRLFAYEAWSSGKLAEDYFAERPIAPGDSLPGAISFDGCTTSPPPLSSYWYIKVGYRIGTKELWLVHSY